jgi:hypothetical protein
MIVTDLFESAPEQGMAEDANPNYIWIQGDFDGDTATTGSTQGSLRDQQTTQVKLTRGRMSNVRPLSGPPTEGGKTIKQDQIPLTLDAGNQKFSTTGIDLQLTVAPNGYMSQGGVGRVIGTAVVKIMRPGNVPESLGDRRPKLGSKRDQGKSVRQWRRDRGMDESGMAEAHGNYAGDTPVNLGGVSVKMIQAGDTVQYIDQKAQVVDMSPDRKYSRITIPSSSTTKTVLTSDLRQLGQGMSESRQIFTEGRHKKLLKEDATYRKFHNLSRLLVERRMSEQEILDLFAAVEAGANATGQNRTALGKGKDVVAGAYTSAKDAISSVMNSIAMSTPVAGVDAAYNDATGALRDAVGNNSKVMNAIKKYRLLAKEYPKTQLFVKTALIALAGMATGGAGLVAIAGVTAAIDAAIKGEKLSSILAKGAGAALLGLGAQEVQAMLSGGEVPVDQSIVPGEEIVTPVTDVTPGVDTVPSRFDDIVSNSVDYQVKPGDTITDILADRNINPDAFRRLPGNEVYFSADGNPNKLIAGKFIKLPDPADAADLNRLSYVSPDVANYERFDKVYDTTGYTGQYNQNSVFGLDAANNLKQQQLGRLGSDNGMSAARIARDAVRESVKLIRLPAEQLIDQKLTVMAWALTESAGKAPSHNMHLTRRGVLTVIENVDRHRRALLKELAAAGPDRTNIPAVPREDMPLAPQDGVVKPGMIGKGLNWLDKATGKVGSYLSKQAQNFTRKVTAAKLKTEWEQEGHQTDSDYIAAFLTKQGVPQGVVTDVYSKMGIPYTAPAAAPVGGAQRQAYVGGINPATKKPWTGDELRAEYYPAAPEAPGDEVAGDAAADTAAAPNPFGQMTKQMQNYGTSTGGRVTGTATGLKNTASPNNPNAVAAAKAAPASTTATTKPATTAAGTFPGEDPQGAGYVGRLEVKRRQAARGAQAANKPATPNFAQQNTGYKSVNYAPNIKTGANLPKPTRSIGALAMVETRIATALKKPVAEMLQMVETKEDVQRIKQFVDQTFVRYGAVNESAFVMRNQILEHVTQVGAQRRRDFAAQHTH